MNIITVPHPTLRTQAQPVTQLDGKVLQFIRDLGKTLEATRKPQGVGLAAPQVDKRWRIFVTRLAPSTPNQNTTSSKTAREAAPVLRAFINPVLVAKSDQVSFGTNLEDPDLEGCLSIPGLYGAVPRAEWVELEYQEVVGDALETTRERFHQFPARVVQHELDHLDGILFTDHSLRYNLPVYRENLTTKRFEEVDRELIAVL
jgi:peptide deformylase